MKKNVPVLVLMLMIALSPQLVLAQTGVDPDPVQSAKNRKANEERQKAQAAEAAKNAPAPGNTKNGPVTVSSPAIVVKTPVNTISTRKFIDPANMDLTIKPGDNFFRYSGFII